MIEYRVEGGAARITLNRPEKRNALNQALIEALKARLAAAGEDPQARVILLSGRGKDFCAGLDIGALAESKEADMLEALADARKLADLFAGMRRNPRPIVAAVQGRALGGGCGIATACDLILAAESAQFGYPEIGMGFVPAVVAAMLKDTVPEKLMLELALTGEPISAPDALRAGMINRVFPDAEFSAGVEAYVSALAAKSKSALSLTKNLLYQVQGLPFEKAIEAGIQANAAGRMTPDFREGVARFANKPRS